MHVALHDELPASSDSSGSWQCQLELAEVHGGFENQLQLHGGFENPFTPYRHGTPLALFFQS